MKSQAIPEVYFVLIEIILVLLSGGIIYERVSAVESKHIFESRFFARDIALILNVLPAVDGNVFYKYNPILLNRNSVSIAGSYVEVGKERYPFAPPANQDIREMLSTPDLLAFYTEGGLIDVSKEERQWNPYQLKCPDVQTTIAKLVIDPAHGTSTQRPEFQGSDGKTGAAGTEAQLVIRIAARLDGFIRQQRETFPVAGTRTLREDTPEAKTISERIAAVQREQNAAILGLSAGQYDASRNVLKIYINAKSQQYGQSYKLACMLLNEITGKPEIRQQLTGAVIVPVDITRLASDNPDTPEYEEDIRKILLPDRTAAYLELGNIDKQDNKLLQPAITEQIAGALQKFRT